jgi:hypothetical protein
MPLIVRRAALDDRRTRPLGVALAAAFVALAGCGGVTTSGTDASGGAPGTGGTTGTAGAGGGSGGGSGSGGGGGIRVCPLCIIGRTCCRGSCVNLANDPFNCGDCGKVCDAATPFCDNGTCARPPCEPNVFCIGTATCCGNQCCPIGTLCCNEQGTSGGPPTCHTPTTDQPTCP